MKIVVVGGGTAGWISALMISKVFKGIHRVTLVESKDIKTIGVGEGSTGFLRGVINNEVRDYGCNEIDFMKFTKSTPKLGILFKDWKDKESSYMEPIDAPYNIDFLTSYPLLRTYYDKDINFSLSSIDGRLIDQKLSPFYIDNDKLIHGNNHAHHFDAKLAAQYFENVCGEGVEKIYGNILDFNLDSDGMVKELILENGITITGDFFIDASGFSRIFSKKMQVEFVPFEEMTLNSAIPFRLNPDQYSSENFYTVAWAHKHGWMWMIPKSDSTGCGYIYDDRYTDQESAKKEVEKSLNMEIEIIKKISFRAGRLERPWTKNVLSVGLSFQFLEPLEATSIHGTIAQLNSFIFFHLKNNLEATINQDNINNYNKKSIDMVEDFRSFILFHYLNNRQDTEFWKMMDYSARSNKKVSKYLSISKNKLLSHFDVQTIYGGISNELYNWVILGMRLIDKNTLFNNDMEIYNFNQARTEEEYLCKYFENKEWITSKDMVNFINQ